MSGQGCKDPLEYFHPQNFCKTTSSDDDDVIELANEAINTADKGGLTPEIHAKYQDQLRKVIDMSPNKIATASYLQELITEEGFTKAYLALRNGCEVVKTCGRGRKKRTREAMEEDGNGNQNSTGNKTVGRSTRFSICVRSGEICQVTGAPSTELVSAHILPFSSHNADDQKVKDYLELIRALFGPDALQRLLENVLNGSNESERNINRLDNGIALQSTVHGMWDSMKFFLEVDWNTYNPSTKEVRRYPYS